MTYFADLSENSRAAFRIPGTKNVGWLSLRHEFPKEVPTDEFLDLLWSYCKISVAQTRGLHECEFCPPNTSNYVVRNEQRLLLGSAEIRAFGLNYVIYAAPTLIYHYVAVHHYKPPDEFVRALSEGPRPFSDAYAARLKKLGLDWHETSSPAEKPKRLTFVRSPDGSIERKEID
jgi:hypothetical protein